MVALRSISCIEDSAGLQVLVSISFLKVSSYLSPFNPHCHYNFSILAILSTIQLLLPTLPLPFFLPILLFKEDIFGQGILFVLFNVIVQAPVCSYCVQCELHSLHQCESSYTKPWICISITQNKLLHDLVIYKRTITHS